MDITIKNSWEDITWSEYTQIEQILNTDIPSDYKAVHLVSVLTGISVDELERLPISQFQRLLPALDFLYTEPDTHVHQFEYTVNGRQYKFTGKIDEITTAQYIDYRSYMEKDDKDVVELMSAFMIPVGHDYNDGYDMEQVRNDIGDMCWLDVRAAAFFFRLWLASYITIFKSSLMAELKQQKKTLKTKQEVKQLKQQMKELETSLDSSVWSLLFSESVTMPRLNLTK